MSGATGRDEAALRNFVEDMARLLADWGFPRMAGRVVFTLMAADERSLSSLWLLWLVAVTVLLLNAAYQDGTVERPYGAALSMAMRCVPPLLTVIALTATYALYVRIEAYGLTVGRFWGFVTACVGLAHAVAASIAAVRAGPWLGYTSKTNPLLAAGLALVLILALTPVLSPYRLSASSQQGIALETDIAPDVKLRANRELIGQALVNLVENGLKYYEPVEGRAGKIRIGAELTPVAAALL